MFEKGEPIDLADIEKGLRESDSKVYLIATASLARVTQKYVTDIRLSLEKLRRTLPSSAWTASQRRSSS
jgi:hypothetical protein